MKYAQRAAPPPSGDRLEFVMSDASMDRMGDVIEADGWDLTNFLQHPIALFNHDRDQVIGKWTNVRVHGGQLVGKLVPAAAGTSPLVDTIRALLDQDILRAVSVGFKPLEKAPLTAEADDFWGPFRFIKQELLECSLVAVPANPNALQIARSFGLPREALAAVFGEPAQEPARPAVALHREPAKSLARHGAKMNVSQRIESARTELVAMRDRLKALSDKPDLSDNDLAEIDDLAGVDNAPGRIKEAEKNLTRLENIERGIAGTAASQQQDQQQPRIPGVPALAPRSIAMPKKLEPIDYFFRVATCFALAKANRAPDPMEFHRDRYRGDELTGQALQFITRAPSGPALTTQANWAAELVQIGFADFLSTLKPFSIYPVLAAKGPRFTFGPNANTIKIPTRAGGLIAGAFVAEANPIPVRKLGLSSKTLTPCKMGVITMFSEEIANRSTPQIETLLRDEMTADTAAAIDQALIDTTVESVGLRPAGLRAGVSGLTPTATGTNAEKMVGDLKQLVAAITAAGGGRDIVVLLNPAQAMSLNFAQTTTGAFLFSGVTQAGDKFQVTFVVSQTVTAGLVIAVDAADFASATGDVPRFRLSAEATVHDEDPASPLSAVGAPNVVAAPIRSFYQTDVMGIRMLWDMYWVMRRNGMVSWMTGITAW